MKDTQASKPRKNADDNLLPEYDFDYRKARSNRFATPTSKAPLTSTLAPDVADVFTTEYLQVLSKLGVELEAVREYQILCLPENIHNASDISELVDAVDSTTLSELLKEKGVKCANSYDIGLDASISERRSSEVWLGVIWVLNHAALPLLMTVVGRLIEEKKIEHNENIENSEAAKVHAELKILDGKVWASIKYDGDANTFLKLLKGINPSEKIAEIKPLEI